MAKTGSHWCLCLTDSIVVVGASDGEVGTETTVAVAYVCDDDIFCLFDNLPQPHGQT